MTTQCWPEFAFDATTVAHPGPNDPENPDFSGMVDFSTATPGPDGSWCITKVVLNEINLFSTKKWNYHSNFGCTGEVRGPHGARPSEGMLAPECHSMPWYLHHWVPSKVNLVSILVGFGIIWLTLVLSAKSKSARRAFGNLARSTLRRRLSTTH